LNELNLTKGSKKLQALYKTFTEATATTNGNDFSTALVKAGVRVTPNVRGNAWQVISADRAANLTQGIPIKGGPVKVNGRVIANQELAEAFIKHLIDADLDASSVLPVVGSGGPGEVYHMHPTRLKAADPAHSGDPQLLGYIGETVQGAASRMKNQDHVAKTIDASAPDHTLIGRSLTVPQMQGLEGILVHYAEQLHPGLWANDIPARNMTAPKNATVLAEGFGVLAQWYRNNYKKL